VDSRQLGRGEIPEAEDHKNTLFRAACSKEDMKDSAENMVSGAIGFTIAGALLFYLLRSEVKAAFAKAAMLTRLC
jgi:hypothetical protein